MNDKGIVRVGDFGARGDGTTLDTAALQQAIDACHEAGGGRVVVGAGVFRVGTLDLRSHVELHLMPGCRLAGSPRLEDYSPLVAEGFHPEAAPEASTQSLLRAVDAENIAITGQGVIDGGGLAFYEDAAGGTEKLAKPATPRPRIGMFFRCRNLRIQDVSLVDSACWTLWLMQCTEAHINRVSITGNRRMRNVDGIDLDACRNVTVSDCIIDTEDDSLVLRAIQRLYDAPAVCENIVVTNCVLKSSCQGVRIGCPSDGTIRNSVFSNLVIKSTANGIVFQNPHVYLSPDTSGSANIENISFSNVSVTCRNTPILLYVAEGIALKKLGDLSFSGFRIRSGKPCQVSGSPETIIRDIDFNDVRIETSGDDAILCRYCAGVRMNHVALSNRATSDE